MRMLLNDYLDYMKTYNVVPIYKIYDEHMLTPISTFIKLNEYNPSYILESIGDSKNLGRFSFVGLETIPLVETDDHLSLEEVEKIISIYKGPEILSLPPYYAGIVGYMAYNAIEDIHPIKLKHKAKIPIYQFVFSKTVVVIDHLKHQLIIICNSSNPTEEAYTAAIAKIDEIYKKLQGTTIEIQNKYPKQPELLFESNFKKNDYISSVNKIKEYIVAGDIFQAVLSQKFTAKGTIDGFNLYRHLRKENPSPYLSYIRFPGFEILSSSPEMLVRMVPDLVETSPIAGTRAVKNDGRDHLRETELLNDEKDSAEHLMLVDLGRNDIGKISQAGTVEVNEYHKVKYFSKVMHLVSSITGIPLEKVTPVDALRATFPAGTVSGAPKLRAMEIIDELEPDSRDLYAGSIVLLNQSGHLNSCISIRTIQLRDNQIIIQAGGGIVYDSIPEHEFLESLNKASAMFKAVEKAYKGDVKYDFDYR